MRRLLAVIAFTLLVPALALAQSTGPQGKCQFSSNCAASPQFGSAQCCFDTTTWWVYFWSFTDTAFEPTGNHVTVGNLPACAAGQNGLHQLVTDSTSVASEGQTCTGSSTNKALAICVGTTWKCF